MKPEDLSDVARDVAAILDRHGVAYLISGMFAGNYWLGDRARRTTFDVDVVVYVSEEGLQPALEGLRAEGWEVQKRGEGLYQMRLPSTLFAIDLLLAWTPPRGKSEEERALAAYEEERLRRRKKVPLAGVRLWFSTPEDVVVTKTFLDRAKDVADVCLLMRIEGLDRRYLNRWLKRLGLTGRFLEILEKCRKEETQTLRPGG